VVVESIYWIFFRPTRECKTKTQATGLFFRKAIQIMLFPRYLTPDRNCVIALGLRVFIAIYYISSLLNDGQSTTALVKIE
jgi:hypothetical protein